MMGKEEPVIKARDGNSLPMKGQGQSADVMDEDEPAKDTQDGRFSPPQGSSLPVPMALQPFLYPGFGNFMPRKGRSAKVMGVKDVPVKVDKDSNHQPMPIKIEPTEGNTTTEKAPLGSVTCKDAPSQPVPIKIEPTEKVTKGSYSIKFKLFVVAKAKELGSCRKTGKLFGIDEKIIRTWIKCEPKLQQTPPTAKRLAGGGRPIKNKQLDQQLLQWIKDKFERNEPVSGRMLMEQARVLSDAGDAFNFKASAGWLARFKKRHNIASMIIDERTTGNRYLPKDQNGRFVPNPNKAGRRKTTVPQRVNEAFQGPEGGMFPVDHELACFLCNCHIIDSQDGKLGEVSNEYCPIHNPPVFPALNHHFGMSQGTNMEGAEISNHLKQQILEASKTIKTQLLEESGMEEPAGMDKSEDLQCVYRKAGEFMEALQQVNDKKAMAELMVHLSQCFFSTCANRNVEVSFKLMPNSDVKPSEGMCHDDLFKQMDSCRESDSADTAKQLEALDCFKNWIENKVWNSYSLSTWIGEMNHDIKDYCSGTSQATGLQRDEGGDSDRSYTDTGDESRDMNNTCASDLLSPNSSMEESAKESCESGSIDTEAEHHMEENSTTRDTQDTEGDHHMEENSTYYTTRDTQDNCANSDSQMDSSTRETHSSSAAMDEPLSGILGSDLYEI